MVDNSMTFSNTLMQLGGEDRVSSPNLCSTVSWRLTSLSASTQNAMSAATNVRLTVTATVTASTTPDLAH